MSFWNCQLLYTYSNGVDEFRVAYHAILVDVEVVVDVPELLGAKEDAKSCEEFVILKTVKYTVLIGVCGLNVVEKLFKLSSY